MRKLTAGNKARFAVFTLIVISIIVILVIFLNRALAFEKEEYEITKDVFIYDTNYEYIDLTKDALITKKWTGRYYLTEPETGLSYDLGNSVIAYDSIKNRINLYGTFYEVGLDGEVTKTNKDTEVSDILNSKLYKIEDRKYLLVSKNITTENSSLSAENYLIVVIDKSGNTLLLNNNMDVKTINAIVLQTDTFKFDVANEKLLYNDTKIDLTKIIGSTNQYVEPKEEEKTEESDDSNNSGEQLAQNGGTSVNVGGSIANSSNNSSAIVGGTTILNPGTTNVGSSDNSSDDKENTNNDNNGASNNNNSNTGTNTQINATKVVKSVSLRSVTPGQTYLDVNYIITDPENKYQVVYLNIDGGGTNNIISLDKTRDYYRITGLIPNTEYTVTLGYKEIKSDATIEEVTEDILNVKTSKLGGRLEITKLSLDKIYFNIQLDKNSSYEDAILRVYINNVKTDETVTVDTESALLTGGWTSNIDRTDEMNGKVTLKLENVKDVDLSTSIQIY